MQNSNIAGNNIEDNAAKYFATALLDNSRLGDLNMSHNKLGDGAGEMLGNALGKQTTVICDESPPDPGRTISSI